MLKVTLKKSLIGSLPKDDAVLAGKLKVIGHLVVVEKA